MTHDITGVWGLEEKYGGRAEEYGGRATGTLATAEEGEGGGMDLRADV
jgi:hypothetical protein